jgi:hypothetical protein
MSAPMTRISAPFVTLQVFVARIAVGRATCAWIEQGIDTLPCRHAVAIVGNRKRGWICMGD